MIDPDKQKILKTLIAYEQIPTGRLASINGIFYPKAKILLEELEKEKLVKSKKETIATYWDITPKGKKEVDNGKAN